MATTIAGTGYIPRKDFMVMANVGTAEAPSWELIGDRVEEMSLKMNPNIETVSDITGMTETTLDKYQIETEVTPMRAKRDSKLFGILYDIVKNERTLSEVERDFLCVSVFDSETSTGAPATTSYAAWKQRAVIAVQSFGGGTAGLDIPFVIHWVGEKTQGKFEPKSKLFTAA
ncbi:MAG: hypothetical protein RR209_00865 [Angelakisella sp.]